MSENPYNASDSNPIASQVPQRFTLPELKNLQYPLNISFKLLALAPQLSVTDANGNSIVYIKQKLFKLKEKIEVFTDKSKEVKIGTIQANKMIDWSARYYFVSEAGDSVGSVGRKGMRSLWKASYETTVGLGEEPHFKISEENPFAKICDSFLSEIPILGMLSSYLFHPKYGATSVENEQVVMRLTKKPAFFEGKFELEKLEDINNEQEVNLLLSFIMLMLLERKRG